ncbi:MMB_0454 family protein [Mycoplasmopsis iners]|uniref:MMB_0454 family protein n=1 Tax=Mycoplasmopsis iners TaxID=76630 RepID=UPI000495FDD7|nr:hypothetical protein [Mycoplasmopsis iners]
MNYVTVNYSVNQSYSITEDAFVQLVHNCISDVPYIKLANEPRIIFTKSHDNVGFVIDVKIKKDKNFHTVINNFAKELENRFVALLDIKPESLKICFTGLY